jgi:4-hydroxy-2-oxoheptanedioate aldolase
VSSFKARLARGEPAVAFWMTEARPALLEPVAAAGLDAVLIDMEHTSLGLRDVEDLCRVARLAGVTPVVRPPRADSEAVGRLLDCGAEGIVFPQVVDAAGAERARRSLRYPPDGTRGWGPNARQLLADPATIRSRAYADAADADLLSLFLIESSEGVRNVEQILDAGRPDAVAFGWSDQMVELDFDLGATVAAASRVHEACRARGIGVALYPGPHHGLAAGTGEVPWYPGCFMIAGMDAQLLTAAARDAIVSARAAQPAS